MRAKCSPPREGFETAFVSSKSFTARRPFIDFSSIAADEKVARSDAVARGEIIESPSSASCVVTPNGFHQYTSRAMLSSPAEFAGPISLISILSRMSAASLLMTEAKRLNGKGLKFTAGSQSTTTRLVPYGETKFGSSIASHSSHGSSKARSIEGAFGVGCGSGAFGGAGGGGGGQLSVTNPICSPSIGINPLSLNPSSTACRERKRDSPCSL